MQAQCVEIHRGSINIEETGWNQNTEGPYYEEMLGESISSKRPRARGMMAESRWKGIIKSGEKNGKTVDVYAALSHGLFKPLWDVLNVSRRRDSSTTKEVGVHQQCRSYFA